MKAVNLWLITCSLLIVLIVWIGGITRLTGAGLSITEWRPITGIIPPLTEKAWSEEKTKYQHTPEYEKINFDISLSEFKKIYIIEYIHRLAARLVGLVFLLPFIYFLIKDKLEKRTITLMLIALVLGALQGFMGWYMVKSGLINEPHVNHYRLAAHLFLATTIFVLLCSEAFVTGKNKIVVSRKGRFLLMTIIILTVLQIMIGALVAGLKAGLSYNTFPLMDGELIPGGLFFIKPYWKNFFENITSVQFLHRWVGVIILIQVIALNYLNKNKLNFALLGVITLQITLGILAILYQVPIIIASLHQVTAFAILATLIFYYRKC